MKYLPILALILNFSGALFLIFSTGAYVDKKNKGGVLFGNIGENGKPMPSIFLLNPKRFKTGLWLIVAGFFIQLILEILNLRGITWGCQY